MEATISISGGTSPYSWTLSWGDEAGNSGSKASATKTHHYSASGQWTITLTVTDSAGRIASASKKVQTGLSMSIF